MKTVNKLLIVLLIFLIPSCVTPDRDIIFDNAIDIATGKFIQRLESSPKLSEIKRIGVLKIKGDENGHIRDIIMNRLVDIAGLEVMTPQDNEEMDAIIDQYAREMKKGYLYDEKTLLQLGSLKGNRSLIIGKVEKTSIGIREGRVKFQLKVLDMEKGRILLSGLFEGDYFHPVETRDYAVAILISSGILAVLAVIVYSIGLYSLWPVWLGIIVCALIPFWFLVGRFLII